MPIGISEEHEALRATARRFLDARCPPSVPRSYLEAEVEEVPPFWAELAAQGWLGLAVEERYGGQGYGSSRGRPGQKPGSRVAVISRVCRTSMRS